MTALLAARPYPFRRDVIRENAPLEPGVYVITDPAARFGRAYIRAGQNRAPTSGRSDVGTLRQRLLHNRDPKHLVGKRIVSRGYIRTTAAADDWMDTLEVRWLIEHDAETRSRLDRDLHRRLKPLLSQ